MPSNPERDCIHIGAVTGRITVRAGRLRSSAPINLRSLNSQADTLTETAHSWGAMPIAAHNGSCQHEYN